MIAIKDILNTHCLSLNSVEVSLESISGNVPIYIVLTDTKTRFSKISKWITKDPYNHVSLSLTESLDELYTYTLVTKDNGIRGGIMVERKEDLIGANYSLYNMYVNEDTWLKLKETLDEMSSNPPGTKYNHLSLINAILGKPVFKNDAINAYICSQFVVEVLRRVGISIFDGRDSSTVKPYDLIKFKSLKHVRRGKIK